MDSDAADADLLSRFHHPEYLRHTARRLEHLASLALPLRSRSVLEVGAGIGDLSGYFLDRGCRLTITEPRATSIVYLRQRYPGIAIHQFDVDGEETPPVPAHEVVFCYGVLYHLAKPARALATLAAITTEMLLLETCVSFGEHSAENPVAEEPGNPTEAISGCGCRPTRPWIVERLGELFPFVYQPITQPAHPEFPLDWAQPAGDRRLSRAIFVASRRPLESAQLSSGLRTTHLPQP